MSQQAPNPSSPAQDTSLLAWVDDDSEWFDTTPWSWDVNKVCDYIANTATSKYDKCFRGNHVNGARLLRITTQSLCELGITDFDERKILMNSIQKAQTIGKLSRSKLEHRRMMRERQAKQAERTKKEAEEELERMLLRSSQVGTTSNMMTPQERKEKTDQEAKSQAVELKNVLTLVAWLRNSGVFLSKWGSKAQPLIKELFERYEEGFITFWQNPVPHVLICRVKAKISRLSDNWQLVKVGTQMADGQFLVATTLLTETLHSNYSPEEGALRSISEEFGSEAWDPNMIREISTGKTTFRQERSNKYPGVLEVTRTTEVFIAMEGLPLMSVFTTFQRERIKEAAAPVHEEVDRSDIQMDGEESQQLAGAEVDGPLIAKHIWRWVPSKLSAAIEAHSEAAEMIKSKAKPRKKRVKSINREMEIAFLDWLGGIGGPDFMVEEMTEGLRELQYFRPDEMASLLQEVNSPQPREEISIEEFCYLRAALQPHIFEERANAEGEVACIDESERVVLLRLFPLSLKMEIILIWNNNHTGKKLVQVMSTTPQGRESPMLVTLDLRERILVAKEHGLAPEVAQFHQHAAMITVCSHLQDQVRGGIRWSLTRPSWDIPQLQPFRGAEMQLMALADLAQNEQQKMADGDNTTPSQSSLLHVIDVLFTSCMHLATLAGSSRETVNLLRFYDINNDLRSSIFKVDPAIKEDVEKAIGFCDRYGRILGVTGCAAHFRAFAESVRDYAFRGGGEERYVGLVHGSLWRGNVVIDPEGSVYLCAYHRMARGPVLQDLAAMEAAILFQSTVLRDENDLNEALRLTREHLPVKTLKTTFGTELSATIQQKPTSVRHSFSCVNKIREYVSLYCRDDDDPLQLCAALLHFSLKAVRSRSTSVMQKQWALASAMHMSAILQARIDGTLLRKMADSQQHLDETHRAPRTTKLSNHLVRFEQRQYLNSVLIDVNDWVEPVSLQHMQVQVQPIAVTKIGMKLQDAIDACDENHWLQLCRLESRTDHFAPIFDESPCDGIDQLIPTRQLPGGHRTLIFGSPGSGKTFLARKICTVLVQRHFCPGLKLPIIFPLYVNSWVLAHIVESQKLSSSDDLLGEYMSAVHGLDSNRLQILMLLRKANRLILVVDGLDQTGQCYGLLETYFMEVIRQNPLQRMFVTLGSPRIPKFVQNARRFSLTQWSKPTIQGFVRSRITDEDMQKRAFDAVNAPIMRDFVLFSPILLSGFLSMWNDSDTTTPGFTLPQTCFTIFEASLRFSQPLPPLWSSQSSGRQRKRQAEQPSFIYAAPPGFWQFLGSLAISLHRDNKTEFTTDALSAVLEDFKRSDFDVYVTRLIQEKTLDNVPIFSTLSYNANPDGTKSLTLRFGRLIYQQYFVGWYVAQMLDNASAGEKFMRLVPSIWPSSLHPVINVAFDPWWHRSLLLATISMQDQTFNHCVHWLLDSVPISETGGIPYFLMRCRAARPQSEAFVSTTQPIVDTMKRVRTDEMIHKCLLHPSIRIRMLCISEIMDFDAAGLGFCVVAEIINFLLKTLQDRQQHFSIRIAAVRSIVAFRQTGEPVVSALVDEWFDSGSILVQRECIHAITVLNAQHAPYVVQRLFCLLHLEEHTLAALRIIAYLKCADRKILSRVLVLAGGSQWQVREQALQTLQTMPREDIVSARSIVYNLLEDHSSQVKIAAIQTIVAGKIQDRQALALVERVVAGAMHEGIVKSHAVRALKLVGSIDSGVEGLLLWLDELVTAVAGEESMLEHMTEEEVEEFNKQPSVIQHEAQIAIDCAIKTNLFVHPRVQQPLRLIGWAGPDSNATQSPPSQALEAQDAFQAEPLPVTSPVPDQEEGSSRVFVSLKKLLRDLRTSGPPRQQRLKQMTRGELAVPASLELLEQLLELLGGNEGTSTEEVTSTWLLVQGLELDLADRTGHHCHLSMAFTPDPEPQGDDCSSRSNAESAISCDSDANPTDSYAAVSAGLRLLKHPKAGPFAFSSLIQQVRAARHHDPTNWAPPIQWFKELQELVEQGGAEGIFLLREMQLGNLERETLIDCFTPDEVPLLLLEGVASPLQFVREFGVMATSNSADGDEVVVAKGVAQVGQQRKAAVRFASEPKDTGEPSMMSLAVQQGVVQARPNDQSQGSAE